MMKVTPSADRGIAGPFVTAGQTLAIAFGSAAAGMVANLAGFAVATNPAEVAAVGPWLFGTIAVVPLAACLTAWRTFRLTGRASRDM